MLKSIELWQVPLLVAGAILLGNLTYAWIVKRSSRLTAARIKLVGASVLIVVALALTYRLIRLDRLPVFVSLVTVTLDAFVAWVAMQELKELRRVKKERDEQEQPAE